MKEQSGYAISCINSFCRFDLDPCRLTIDTLSAGLPGHSADELLAQKNIYVEMSDEQYLVLILTCRDDEAALTVFGMEFYP